MPRCSGTRRQSRHKNPGQGERRRHIPCGFPPLKQGSHMDPSFWRGAFLPLSLRGCLAFSPGLAAILEVLGREEGEKPANPKPTGTLQAVNPEGGLVGGGGGQALLLVAGGACASAPPLPHHTGNREPRRQNAPNELVKHLYNFSSFYKEGLLYTIYTWR